MLGNLRNQPGMARRAAQIAPRMKPVHIQSGKAVYEIGQASSDEEADAALEAYCETLLQQGDSLTMPGALPCRRPEASPSDRRG